MFPHEKTSRTTKKILSQQLRNDRLDQTHVLGPPDRQPVQRKVSYHHRHRAERFAELSQDEGAVGGVPLDPHVHESPGAPGNVNTLGLRFGPADAAYFSERE